MKSDYLRNPNMKLAHAYVPVQQYSENFSLEDALQKGTLFPELWMPYKKEYR
ncbi:MAG: spore coat associated protein CotJA [Halanaerobiaceae bacterium]